MVIQLFYCNFLLSNAQQVSDFCMMLGEIGAQYMYVGFGVDAIGGIV